ncbi:MAG: hypothetical protein Q8P67_22795 [archaeon]|nr:hypothetical protein [archaeon]
MRLVCRVADLASGAVEASDGIQVLVRFQTGQPQTTYVEVIGIVESDGSIREEMTVSFGETFHLQNYDQVIQLSQQFPVPFSQ